MSHNRNERPNDDVDSGSSEGHERAHHEAYIPRHVPNSAYGTPIIGGRSPVLISNSDLMEQLYRMGDALNSYEARSRGEGSRDGRFQNVTPRRLEYPDDGMPVVEILDEETVGQGQSRGEQRPSPHPHRSGRSESEVRRAGEVLRDQEQRLNRLKERLGIRLDNDDLRLLLVEWQRDREVRGEQPHDPEPHGHERAHPRGNSGSDQGARPRDSQRAPPDLRYDAPYRGGPSGGRTPHITHVSSQSRSGGRYGEQRTRPPNSEDRARPPSPNSQVQGNPRAQGQNQNPETVLPLTQTNQAPPMGGAQPPPAEANIQIVPAVREAQLPAGYRNTTNDLRFHGNADPVEFLGRFNIKMDIYQVPDLARCRLLAATFRESAQQWFQKLGLGVITSWDQMKTLLLTKFQSTVKYAPPVNTLANIKQKGESLQSYFKRFNAESTLVRGAIDESLKSFLIAGLQVGTNFWKHLQGKDPSTLADLFAQAE
ncbi:hypothetical protein POM88_004417 [Heracleum sosnowskyi]|uniref:Retrotransposon gag domain-containing protein n=1 Tax=Heracleum sosnowskyi TaxID=360622 RepID=A0AAD8JHY2_9APIA|nr:hypothetical protein POM88_004417 [Heracleum sosnowskyi]